MKYFLIIFLAFTTLHAYAQSKIEYLQNNRFDLTSPDFEFPQKNFKIIGFGVYH